MDSFTAIDVLVVVAEAMSQLGSKQKAAMSVWLLLRLVTDS